VFLLLFFGKRRL